MSQSKISTYKPKILTLEREIQLTRRSRSFVQTIPETNPQVEISSTKIIPRVLSPPTKIIKELKEHKLLLKSAIPEVSSVSTSKHSINSDDWEVSSPSSIHKRSEFETIKVTLKLPNVSSALLRKQKAMSVYEPLHQSPTHTLKISQPEPKDVISNQEPNYLTSEKESECIHRENLNKKEREIQKLLYGESFEVPSVKEKIKLFQSNEELHNLHLSPVKFSVKEKCTNDEVVKRSDNIKNNSRKNSFHDRVRSRSLIFLSKPMSIPIIKVHQEPVTIHPQSKSVEPSQMQKDEISKTVKSPLIRKKSLRPNSDSIERPTSILEDPLYSSCSDIDRQKLLKRMMIPTKKKSVRIIKETYDGLNLHSDEKPCSKNTVITTKTIYFDKSKEDTISELFENPIHHEEVLKSNIGGKISNPSSKCKEETKSDFCDKWGIRPTFKAECTENSQKRGSIKPSYVRSVSVPRPMSLAVFTKESVNLNKNQPELETSRPERKSASLLNSKLIRIDSSKYYDEHIYDKLLRTPSYKPKPDVSKDNLQSEDEKIFIPRSLGAYESTKKIKTPQCVSTDRLMISKRLSRMLRNVQHRISPKNRREKITTSMISSPMYVSHTKDMSMSNITKMHAGHPLIKHEQAQKAKGLKYNSISNQNTRPPSVEIIPPNFHRAVFARSSIKRQSQKKEMEEAINKLRRASYRPKKPPRTFAHDRQQEQEKRIKHQSMFLYCGEQENEMQSKIIPSKPVGRSISVRETAEKSDRIYYTIPVHHEEDTSLGRLGSSLSPYSECEFTKSKLTKTNSKSLGDIPNYISDEESSSNESLKENIYEVLSFQTSSKNPPVSGEIDQNKD